MYLRRKKEELIDSNKLELIDGRDIGRHVL